MEQYLNKHFSGKARQQRQSYMLRKILWLAKNRGSWHTSFRTCDVEKHTARFQSLLKAQPMGRGFSDSEQYQPGFTLIQLKQDAKWQRASEILQPVPGEMRSLCGYQKCDGFHIPMRWRFNADQVLEKSLMAILEFPFIQRLTQHILPLIVLPDKIRDLKLRLKEDLKEGFGFHFTLIFIQFQSRTHPRNLLTWFQHYDKESGGKRLFNFKLAIILHPSYWNSNKQTRGTSLCGHLSKFSGRGRGCVEIS